MNINPFTAGPSDNCCSLFDFVLEFAWIENRLSAINNTGSRQLKVPKCEIFDRSDFHDFYTIKSRPEGDFGVKIKNF